MLSTSSNDRRLVPQWKSVSAAISSNELAMPDGKQTRHSYKGLPTDLLKRVEQWRLSPTLISAAELLESAIVLGHESEALGACRAILQADAMPLIKQGAAIVLARAGVVSGNLPFDECANIPSIVRTRDEARFGHIRTRLSPRDALAWVELARIQTCHGHLGAAEKSMKIALSLAPNNRHVLRSASRLFFSLGDFERAHDVLKRSPATPHDPWLIAAEVALSFFATRKATFLKRGLEVIEADTLIPSQITELACALGTQIHIDGNHRRGRRLVSQSLLAPTGNTLAQVEWVALRFGGVTVGEQDLKRVPNPWEVSAMLAFYREGTFEEATAFTNQWIADEPYNANAYSMAATVASTLENFQEAIKFARNGLTFDRVSLPLRTSMAFSFASLNRLQEAEEILRSIGTGHGVFDSITDANRGLIAFRRGEIESGINLYRNAIITFKRLPGLDFEPSARAFFACELARVGRFPEARAQIEEAEKLNKTLRRPSVDLVLKRAKGLFVQNGATP